MTIRCPDWEVRLRNTQRPLYQPSPMRALSLILLFSTFFRLFSSTLLTQFSRPRLFESGSSFALVCIASLVVYSLVLSRDPSPVLRDTVVSYSTAHVSNLDLCFTALLELLNNLLNPSSLDKDRWSQMFLSIFFLYLLLILQPDQPLV